MEQDIFLLDSPAIEKAVMAHNTEVTRRRRFGKSSLNEIPEVSGGSSEKEYTGQFAIRYLGDRTFQVIFPEHDYAGTTDLPGVGEVPVTTITVPENSNGGDINLYACHKDDKYSVVIMLKHSGANPPDGYFDYVRLGNVYPSGRVDQYYTRNEEIQFSRTWFL